MQNHQPQTGRTHQEGKQAAELRQKKTDRERKNGVSYKTTAIGQKNRRNMELRLPMDRIRDARRVSILVLCAEYNHSTLPATT